MGKHEAVPPPFPDYMLKRRLVAGPIFVALFLAGALYLGRGSVRLVLFTNGIAALVGVTLAVAVRGRWGSRAPARSGCGSMLAASTLGVGLSKALSDAAIACVLCPIGVGLFSYLTAAGVVLLRRRRRGNGDSHTPG